MLFFLNSIGQKLKNTGLSTSTTSKSWSPVAPLEFKMTFLKGILASRIQNNVWKKERK